MNPDVVPLSADELLCAVGDLAELLIDTVAGGASIGFLDPLDPVTATAWWRTRIPAVRAGRLSVRVSRDDGGRITGTVGVAFADKPNARHRAEIVKLMVHRDARGKGLGRTLLSAGERAAAEFGVTLLLLDTETGSPADTLYRSAGWTAIGVVPGHAADPGGTLRPTTFFYKELKK
ncbi:GNAT family N-acetyltransferase [Streptomyces scopuliridis]|uniref:GNAT family N-acetyltransferase n=1 Tax=Streptomyces scopuliridis TaxID=452529 RepID=A0ACD4ZHD3_9ACTN|nr:GNAT family N-acetyltransferase [Streptomyces scopuliridis]WSB96586.1 GNAT family N-acetyltransferase [Streptomyces scopuliridis]WSC09710.1 GNAT family N-acetyltransferase [Streptomyces scopuliridis]